MECGRHSRAPARVLGLDELRQIFLICYCPGVSDDDIPSTIPMSHRDDMMQTDVGFRYRRRFANNKVIVVTANLSDACSGTLVVDHDGDNSFGARRCQLAVEHMTDSFC